MSDEENTPNVKQMSKLPAPSNSNSKSKLSTASNPKSNSKLPAASNNETADQKQLKAKFQCPYCESKIGAKPDLKRHVKRKHEKEFPTTDFSKILLPGNESASNNKTTKIQNPKKQGK